MKQMIRRARQRPPGRLLRRRERAPPGAREDAARRERRGEPQRAHLDTPQGTPPQELPRTGGSARSVKALRRLKSAAPIPRMRKASGPEGQARREGEEGEPQEGGFFRAGDPIPDAHGWGAVQLSTRDCASGMRRFWNAAGQLTWCTVIPGWSMQTPQGPPRVKRKSGKAPWWTRPSSAWMARRMAFWMYVMYWVTAPSDRGTP